MDLPQATLSRRRLLTGAISGTIITQVGAQTVDTDEVVTSWTQLRSQWVLNPRLAYFDTARMAPRTRAMLVAEYRALEALHSDPAAFFRDRYSADDIKTLCNRLANWLDCTADELCFATDAASGLQGYAQQVPLQVGDEIVLHTQLPPALHEFWQQQARNRGLVVKLVNLPVPLLNSAQVVTAFENALSDRSRILMCSHVQKLDGAILPIKELAALARSRNVLSLIDGSLSLGALQFSLSDLGCDAYGSSFAHWLNGPEAGLLYLRRDLHATLNTNSVTQPQLDTHDWPYLAGLLPTVITTNASQLQVLPLALGLQERIGRARIEARLLELQTYARLQVQTLADVETLTPTQPGMYLHLLSVRPLHRNAEQLANWLRTNDQVLVSAIGAASIDPTLTNVLRISLNLYNSFDDIDRMVMGLRRALRS